MSQVTTTRNGFRTEDITFRNARKQSAILDEMEHEELPEEEVKAPVSLTPEQVKAFYLLKITNARDSNEKRLYAQTIRWIDELLETKKKLFALEAKEVIENDDGTAKDLERDVQKVTE